MREWLRFIDRARFEIAVFLSGLIEVAKGVLAGTLAVVILLIPARLILTLFSRVSSSPSYRIG